MYLTDEEKRMLNGEHGYLVQKSMEILVTLGDIFGAEKLLPIQNVHSPGVSYRVAGDAGLNYVRKASQQGAFRVFTTLNTVGMDTENSAGLGFPDEFCERQLELLDAYRQMGAIPTYTCTPYLVGNIPQPGEHVAWGESSAITFVNSVIGARTNREGGPSALAAAVTGRVPAYGLHLDHERKAKFVIQLEMNLNSDTDYAILGYYAGQIAGKETPLIEGVKKRPTLESLKAFSAAVASSGAVALYHIVGITPEAFSKEKILSDHYESVKFSQQEYQVIKNKFMHFEIADLIVIGCPHCSITELRMIANGLNGKKITSDVWICTSRLVNVLAEKMGYIRVIEKAGARIVCDTCPILCPTSSRGYRNMATNSVKLAHYAPGLWNVKTGLYDLETCLEIAIGKRKI